MLQELENLYALCFPDKKTKWTKQDFLDLKNSGAEIIASQNSFIVWRNVFDEAELIIIGVAPAARRTGTASALLKIMEEDAKKSGVKKIFLEVAERNIPAKALYEKNGYKQIAIRKNYYEDGDNAIIMNKGI
ncbi:MAG: ribosomal protein S18-alanine N-acetyltransferase [Alphaproteobacteria bacterium]